ncbi:hypothetical protein PR002_g20753 [Phytophthora rubi]|uniref:Secreted protein n=1 Tax=Phytophthora rubi TaxID=129364 RepID=A0A6A3JJE0_9STRA|nr:hypothetical protein PR002_g20753 [Phytophthora rubi]
MQCLACVLVISSWTNGFCKLVMLAFVECWRRFTPCASSPGSKFLLSMTTPTYSEVRGGDAACGK